MEYITFHMSKPFFRTFLALTVASKAGLANNPEEVEFFEDRIRPVLAEHCYECHNSVHKAKGDLVLDYKDGLLTEEKQDQPSYRENHRKAYFYRF